ncbi:hypothetical protein [Brumimicrobium mesophilum]|uniref:hypothetical protein n=1 Tax=Brumimicrobium mesophilum TaxID=392717 RepID=UPI000D144C08|nr:hypothetical protein [Brumimicrobium mesophilum]
MKKSQALLLLLYFCVNTQLLLSQSIIQKDNIFEENYDVYNLFGNSSIDSISYVFYREMIEHVEKDSLSLAVIVDVDHSFFQYKLTDCKCRFTTNDFEIGGELKYKIGFLNYLLDKAAENTKLHVFGITGPSMDSHSLKFYQSLYPTISIDLQKAYDTIRFNTDSLLVSLSWSKVNKALNLIDDDWDRFNVEMVFNSLRKNDFRSFVQRKILSFRRVLKLENNYFNHDSRVMFDDDLKIKYLYLNSSWVHKDKFLRRGEKLVKNKFYQENIHLFSEERIYLFNSAKNKFIKTGLIKDGLSYLISYDDRYESKIFMNK